MKKTIFISAVCILAFAINSAHSQNWKIIGNSGIVPTQFLGTTDNVTLNFRTNNIQRMTILNTGSVGIGTTTPSARLDINGQIRITDGTQGLGKVLTTDANGLASWQVPISGFPNGGAVGSTPYWNGASWVVSSNNIYNNGGNVGIGTATPSSKLQINGQIKIVDGTQGGGKVLTSDATGLATWQTPASTWSLLGNAGTVNGTHFIGTTDNVPLNFRVNNQKAGRIDPTLYNTFFGYRSTANSAPTGTAGDGNTAIGAESLFSFTSGYANTAVGFWSLYSDLNGSFNNAIGVEALRQNTSGLGNTAIGFQSLYNNTTGSSNVAIGNIAGNNPGTVTHNFVAVGNGAGHVGSNSNTTEIGNSSMTWIGGESGWFLYSDRRIKDNIQSNVPGLSFISKLNPVTYNLDIHKQNELCGIEYDTEWEGMYDIEKIVQTGFIAQEVEQVAKELNYDFNGVQAPTGNAKLYSIQYASFVVPLVKAVQELNTENNELNSEVESLNSEIENLKKENEFFKNEIENLKVAIGITPSIVGREQSAILYQNSPNPFSEKTTIKYFIPESAPKAEIKIYDSNGKEQKSFVISEKGNGQIEFNGNTLPAGIYNYILIVDGKAIGQRQMILTK